MNLLFVHDHRLRKVDNDFYTTGGFSDSVTSRYTSVFEKMTLMCRASQNNKIIGCSKIENPKVEISPIYESKLLPKRNLLNKIENEIKKVDRVIVRMPSMLGIYAAKIAIKQHKKLMVEVVGSAFGSYWYRSIFGKIVAIPLEIVNKRIIKKADYVVYVSEDYLQKEYPNYVNTLGCSDVVLNKRSSKVLELRKEKIKNMSDKNFVLGTLSQIDQKYKGHKNVFEAISILKEQGVNIEYRLAGSGNKNYLLNLAKKYDIEKNVVFCGQIKHDDINEWIDNLDIYIQPSLTEGMPRSVIEAIYRGCPTIVSSAGGMYELIEKDFTFKKGNTSDLVEKISKINPKKLLDMAERNYEFASKFDYDKILNTRNAFLQKFKDGE